MHTVFSQPFGKCLPDAVRRASDDRNFVLVAFGHEVSPDLELRDAQYLQPFKRMAGMTRPFQGYICIARFATAIAASFTASGSVGCAWHVRAMSSAEAPNSIAMVASAIMLPASAQKRCTPSTRSVFASARILTKPSVVRLTFARPFAVKGNLPTL